MTKELLISSSPHETKVAVLEDDQVVELYFQRDTDVGLVGGIYKGRVNRVLPGMQSAFVNIGLERDAFLYVSDFYEDAEEYDRVFTEAEGRLPVSHDEPAADPRPQANPATAAQPGDSPAEPEAGQSGEVMAENAKAPSAAAEPSEAGKASAAPEESGRHEFIGHRRRRGRRFRNSRFAPRTERPERYEQPEHRPVSRSEQREEHGPEVFEVLPGESLARHRIPNEDIPEPAVPAAAESDTPEAPPDLAAPHAAGQGAQDELPGTPETADIEPAISDAEIEAGEPETEDVLMDATETDNGDVADLQAVSAPPVPGEAEQESAPADEPEELSELSPAAEAESSAGNQPPEPEAPSYTLHDSSQRPQMAPRQERRGRGRFRNRYGRRREPESRGHDAPRSANRPLPINELLKEGQEILVQIAKEPLGTKGARITSHIALPGRYLVYMPTIDHTGVSRKIASDEERLRLRNLLLEYKGSLPGGFIVRTAGAGRSDEEIKADIAFLTRLWNDIRAKAERAKAPALLHRDLTLVERILRDLLSPVFRSIRVDSEIEYEHILEFVSRFQPALTGHVKLYTREAPLFDEFGVQAEIDKALRPKVWLKSGGYIVINQTEALVAIDVNTGKYVGKTNRLEDTIVKTNIDAIKEIVRQIRLRDLGGIIVIDFIDMDERRNRTRVVQALEDALRQDRAPTKILSFNEFGLVALTRKRVKHSLERTLCEPCPYCSGAGWVKSVATVSNEILSEARKMASGIEGSALNLRVNPAVASALKARDGVLLSEIESNTGKDVIIKSDSDVHQERFEIF